MWEDIHKFITEIEPLLLIIIPAIFATGIKINNKIKEKREELEKENDVKNREKFLGVHEIGRASCRERV